MDDCWHRFFDNNSTTRPFDEAAKATYDAMFTANPSSVRHPMGKFAAELVNSSRKKILKLLEAKNETGIVFTSGATEANHLAIRGCAQGHIVTSNVEHPSVEALLEHLEKNGRVQVTRVGVENDARVDPMKIANAVTADTVLVTLIHAHGDTGAINDLKEITRLVKEKNPKTLVHSDCTQSFGKEIVDFNNFPELDFFSVSAHKLYGPKGCGMLVHREKLKLVPDFFGGYQELGMRAGTENVPGIVGMTKAFEMYFEMRDKLIPELLEKRNHIETGLKEGGCVVQLLSPPSEHRLPTTLMVAVSSDDRFCNTKLVEELGKRGFCVSVGSACSTLSPKAPPIVEALKIQHRNSVIRISVATYNTLQDCDQLVKNICELVSSGECCTRKFQQNMLQQQNTLQNLILRKLMKIY